MEAKLNNSNIETVLNSLNLTVDSKGRVLNSFGGFVRDVEGNIILHLEIIAITKVGIITKASQLIHPGLL